MMPPPARRHAVKILFIGNSFTQRNDLPFIIEQMAALAPDPKLVETERIITNGASLSQHWNQDDTLGAIPKSSRMLCGAGPII